MDVDDNESDKVLTNTELDASGTVCKKKKKGKKNKEKESEDVPVMKEENKKNENVGNKKKEKNDNGSKQTENKKNKGNENKEKKDEKSILKNDKKNTQKNPNQNEAKEDKVLSETNEDGENEETNESEAKRQIKKINKGNKNQNSKDKNKLMNTNKNESNEALKKKTKGNVGEEKKNEKSTSKNVSGNKKKNLNDETKDEESSEDEVNGNQNQNEENRKRKKNKKGNENKASKNKVIKVIENEREEDNSDSDENDGNTNEKNKNMGNKNIKKNEEKNKNIKKNEETLAKNGKKNQKKKLASEVNEDKPSMKVNESKKIGNEKPPSNETKKINEKEKKNKNDSTGRKDVKQRWHYKEVDGNLFDVDDDAYSLALCVGADLEMGSGIGLEFRHKYLKDLPDLMEQRKTVGEVAFLKERSHYIYFLITKQLSKFKATIQDFVQAIEAWKDLVVEHNIKKIAIAKIGFGLDELEWSDVEATLSRIFSDIDVLIAVYNFTEMEKSSKFGEKLNLCKSVYVPNKALEDVYKADGSENDSYVVYGYQDGFMSLGARSLHKKVNFKKEYLPWAKKSDVGDVYEKIIDPKTRVYIFLINSNKDDEFSYVNLSKCIQKFVKMHQSFSSLVSLQISAVKPTDQEKVINEKITNLFSTLLNKKHYIIYVCWPKEVEDNFETSISNQDSNFNEDSSSVQSLPSETSNDNEKKGVKRSCSLKEVEGDLFSADKSHSLAHCVAADLKMGSGIALEFRHRYRDEIPALMEQRKTVGEVAFLRDGSRYIYYLITKNLSNHKPTMEDFARTIRAWKDLVVEHEVKKLAIPLIGCGLDRLEWSFVKETLLNTFSDVELSITVYHFKEAEQSFSPNSKRLKSNLCTVYYEPYKDLGDIYALNTLENYSYVVYGYQNGHLSRCAESLNEKVGFKNEYLDWAKNSHIGDVREKKINEKTYIYVFFINKSENDDFSYIDLRTCIKKLAEMQSNFPDGYLVSLRINAIEPSEKYKVKSINERIINLFCTFLDRNYYTIHVSWPKYVQDFFKTSLSDASLNQSRRSWNY